MQFPAGCKMEDLSGCLLQGKDLEARYFVAESSASANVALCPRLFKRPAVMLPGRCDAVTRIFSTFKPVGSTSSG